MVVGRCSEHILKDNPNLITIFVLGDIEAKVARIASIHHLSLDDAERRVRYKDKKRKSYHNFYCTGKWGDSRNYDISVNSTRLGIDATTELLYQYILTRIENR